MSHKEYAEKLKAIAEPESLKSLEFAVQITLVAISVSVAWVLLGLWQVVLWFFVLYALVFAERTYVRNAVLLPSKAKFRVALVLNFWVGSAYAGLPAYLWLVDDEIYKFAAMALLVGATLNTLLIRSSLWQHLLCYLIPNTFVFGVIAYSFWSASGLSGETIVALTITACIFVYFVVAVFEANKMHRAYAQNQKLLLQSKKMDAVGKLTSGVAHDFNNLLNVISGNIELLQEPENPFPEGELLSEASSAADRGASLVRHLLAYSRQSDLEPVPVHLNVFLAELKQLLSRLLPTNIQLEFSTDPSLQMINIDETQLHTALLNLAVNARDSMPDGGKLKIAARRLHAGLLPANLPRKPGQGDDFLVLSIADEGSGISPEDLERVVDPFFTTKTKGEGTGLGLSTVVGFVEQSGGSFSINSTLGKGTLVELIFPVDDVALPAPATIIGPKGSAISKPSKA